MRRMSSWATAGAWPSSRSAASRSGARSTAAHVTCIQHVMWWADSRVSLSRRCPFATHFGRLFDCSAPGSHHGIGTSSSGSRVGTRRPGSTGHASACTGVLVSSASISPHLPLSSSGQRSARAGVTRRAIHTIAPFSSPWVIRSTFHPISPARNASRSGSVHHGGGHRDLWLHEAMPGKSGGARWMRGVSASSSRPIVSPILLVRADSVLSTITSDDASKPIGADGSSRSGSRERAGAAVEVIAVPPAPRTTYARRPQSRDGAACQRPPPRVQSVSTPRWESRRSAHCGVAEACTPEPSNRSGARCWRAGQCAPSRACPR